MVDIQRAFEALRIAELLQAVAEAEPHDETLEPANLVYGEVDGRRIVFTHHRAPGGMLVERGVTPDGESFTDVYDDEGEGPNAGPLPQIELDLPELRRRIESEIFPEIADQVVDQVHILSRGDWLPGFAPDDRPIWWTSLRLPSGNMASAYVDAVDGTVLQVSRDSPAILPVPPIPVADGRRGGVGRLLKLRLSVKLLALSAALMAALGNVIAIFGVLVVFLMILAEMIGALEAALQARLRQRLRRARKLAGQAVTADEAGDGKTARELLLEALEEIRDILRVTREQQVFDPDFMDRLDEAEKEIRDRLEK